jgi:hypothetical protein
MISNRVQNSKVKNSYFAKEYCSVCQTNTMEQKYVPNTDKYEKINIAVIY